MSSELTKAWKKVEDFERRYWRRVRTNSDKRPDYKNVVGGLVDITDRAEQLRRLYDNPVDHPRWDIPARDVNRRSIRTDYQDISKNLINDNPEIVIAGGFVLNTIIGGRSADVDMFVVSTKSKRRVTEMIKDQVKDSGKVVITEHSLTFQTDQANLPPDAQIVFRIYKSVTEVLMGFDIGACGVGIYKGRLYATPRAIFEIEHATIMVSMSRASLSYSYRLIKYLGRGLGLHVEGIREYTRKNDLMLYAGDPSQLDMIDFYNRYNDSGKRYPVPQQAEFRGQTYSFEGFLYDHTDYSYSHTSWDHADYISSGHEVVMVEDGRIELSDLQELPTDLVGLTVIFTDGIDDPLVPKIFNLMDSKPYRQGSLSFHPTNPNLAEWVGNNNPPEYLLLDYEFTEEDNFHLIKRSNRQEFETENISEEEGILDFRYSGPYRPEFNAAVISLIARYLIELQAIVEAGDYNGILEDLNNQVIEKVGAYRELSSSERSPELRASEGDLNSIIGKYDHSDEFQEDALDIEGVIDRLNDIKAGLDSLDDPRNDQYVALANRILGHIQPLIDSYQTDPPSQRVAQILDDMIISMQSLSLMQSLGITYPQGIIREAIDNIIEEENLNQRDRIILEGANQVSHHHRSVDSEADILKYLAQFNDVLLDNLQDINEDNPSYPVIQTAVDAYDTLEDIRAGVRPSSPEDITQPSENITQPSEGFGGDLTQLGETEVTQPSENIPGEATQLGETEITQPSEEITPENIPEEESKIPENIPEEESKISENIPEEVTSESQGSPQFTPAISELYPLNERGVAQIAIDLTYQRYVERVEQLSYLLDKSTQNRDRVDGSVNFTRTLMMRFRQITSTLEKEGLTIPGSVLERNIYDDIKQAQDAVNAINNDRRDIPKREDAIIRTGKRMINAMESPAVTDGVNNMIRSSGRAAISHFNQIVNNLSEPSPEEISAELGSEGKFHTPPSELPEEISAELGISEGKFHTPPSQLSEEISTELRTSEEEEDNSEFFEYNEGEQFSEEEYELANLDISKYSQDRSGVRQLIRDVEYLSIEADLINQLALLSGSKMVDKQKLMSGWLTSVNDLVSTVGTHRPSGRIYLSDDQIFQLEKIQGESTPYYEVKRRANTNPAEQAKVSLNWLESHLPEAKISENIRDNIEDLIKQIDVAIPEYLLTRPSEDEGQIGYAEWLESQGGDLNLSLYLDSRIPPELLRVNQGPLAIVVINKMEDAISRGEMRINRKSKNDIRRKAASLDDKANKDTLNAVASNFMVGEYATLLSYFPDALRANNINVTNIKQLSNYIREYILNQYPYLEHDLPALIDYIHRMIDVYYYASEFITEVHPLEVEYIHDYLETVMNKKLLQSGNRLDIRTEVNRLLINLIQYNTTYEGSSVPELRRSSDVKYEGVVDSEVEDLINELIDLLINNNVECSQVASAVILRYIDSSYSWISLDRHNEDNLRASLVPVVAASIPTRCGNLAQEYVDQLTDYLVLPNGYEAVRVMNLLDEHNFSGMKIPEIITEARNIILGDVTLDYLAHDIETLNYYIYQALINNFTSTEPVDNQDVIQFLRYAVIWNYIDRENPDDVQQSIAEALDDAGIIPKDLEYVDEYYLPDGREFREVVALTREETYFGSQGKDYQTQLLPEIVLALRGIMREQVPYLAHGSVGWAKYAERVLIEIRRIYHTVNIPVPKPEREPTFQTEAEREEYLHQQAYERSQLGGVPRRSPIHYETKHWGNNVMDVIGLNLLSAYGY